MTGFGEIHPLPGIWNSLHVNTAVTLPVGVEAYAAFALRVWLTSSPVVSDRTRHFARASAIAALLIGMSGQVAYHLLTQAGVTKAPWEVTTAIACLPVLVLGLGSALAHLLRNDKPSSGLTDSAAAITTHDDFAESSLPGRPGRLPRPPARDRIADAYSAAARVIEAGQDVTRRSLRAAGLRGSNADLGMLACLIRANPLIASAPSPGGAEDSQSANAQLWPDCVSNIS